MAPILSGFGFFWKQNPLWSFHNVSSCHVHAITVLILERKLEHFSTSKLGDLSFNKFAEQALHLRHIGSTLSALLCSKVRKNLEKLAASWWITGGVHRKLSELTPSHFRYRLSLASLENLLSPFILCLASCSNQSPLSSDALCCKLIKTNDVTERSDDVTMRHHFTDAVTSHWGTSIKLN